MGHGDPLRVILTLHHIKLHLLFSRHTAVIHFVDSNANLHSHNKCAQAARSSITLARKVLRPPEELIFIKLIYRFTVSLANLWQPLFPSRCLQALKVKGVIFGLLLGRGNISRNFHEKGIPQYKEKFQIHLKSSNLSLKSLPRLFYSKSVFERNY